MNTKLHLIRTLAIACTALTLATLGHAALTGNALTGNALTNNALTNNALTNNALTHNGLSPQGAQAATPSSPIGAYAPSMSWNTSAIRAEVPAAAGR